MEKEEKTILVSVDNVPKVNFIVERTTTISDIKNVLKSLSLDNIQEKESKFLVNPEKQMNVFDSNLYDNTNISSIWDIMVDPQIKFATKSCSRASPQTCEPTKKKERSIVNKGQGIFNKYFTPGQLETKILIRFRISYEVTEPEDEEELSDDPKTNWENFSYRNGSNLATFVYNVLKPYIPLLESGNSFSWRSEYVRSDISEEHVNDHVELEVTSISVPEPEILKCKKVNCPYKNYFEVCRNCEDEISPNRKMMEEYQKLYDLFIKQVENAERMPYITPKIPYKVNGYIPDVGEIEATLTSY